MGHQLRQPDRPQQAARHAPRERPARARDYRTSTPKRIACECVCVVRKGVQKQVGDPEAGQVLRIRQRRREHQPRGPSGESRFRLAPQIRRRRRVRIEQPQHASRYAGEQPHPDIEHRRRDLVRRVEAAEHERRFRQSALRPRRYARCDWPPAVVHLIAIRKVHESFRKVRLFVRRRHHRIHQNIVPRVAPHRAGIAEVTHLHRRRPQKKYLRPRIGRVALQVHQDVHPVRPDPGGGLSVRTVEQIHELVERLPHLPAGRADVVPPIRISDHAKPPAVVQPDQFRDQVRGGVFLKVRGQVADRNALVARGRQGPFPDRSKLLGRPMLRAQQLLAGRRFKAQKHERIHRPRPRLDKLDQFRCQIVQLAPIAKLFQLVRQLGDRRGESRIDRQRRTERSHRLVRPAKPPQYAAQVPERLGVARLQANCGAIAGHRLFKRTDRLQYIAQVVVRPCEVRRLRDRLAVAGGRFGEHTLLRQQIAEVIRRRREMRIGPDGPAEQLHRLARIAFLKGGYPQQVQRLRLVRRRFQDLGADSGGAGQVARPHQVARQS